MRFDPMNDHNLASDCRSDSSQSFSTAAFNIATSESRVRFTSLFGKTMETEGRRFDYPWLKMTGQLHKYRTEVGTGLFWLLTLPLQLVSLVIATFLGFWGWIIAGTFPAASPTARIIRVTVRRLAKTQPVSTVVKLAKVGVVIVTDNPCNKAAKPDTSSIVSLLARCLRAMSQALSWRLTRFLQISSQHSENCKSRTHCFRRRR
ncbi:hypothetical protein LBMAG52_27850 [Planctomycetia bacterium]|nr:hypothetical protein LBMAG52_27850 [Planctomycetia bacterium]